MIMDAAEGFFLYMVEETKEENYHVIMEHW